IEHVCTAHPRMSKDEWERAYLDAWQRFYSDEHVETVLKRAYVNGMSMSKVGNALTVFGGSARIEGIHPMQFGMGRRKVRTQRRHGMPIVNPLLFHPWRAFDVARNFVRWGTLLVRHRLIRKRIERDERSRSYVDESLRTTAGANAVDEF